MHGGGSTRRRRRRPRNRASTRGARGSDGRRPARVDDRTRRRAETTARDDAQTTRATRRAARARRRWRESTADRCNVTSNCDMEGGLDICTRRSDDAARPSGRSGEGAQEATAGDSSAPTTTATHPTVKHSLDHALLLLYVQRVPVHLRRRVRASEGASARSGRRRRGARRGGGGCEERGRGERVGKKKENERGHPDGGRPKTHTHFLGEGVAATDTDPPPFRSLPISPMRRATTRFCSSRVALCFFVALIEPGRGACVQNRGSVNSRARRFAAPRLCTL